MRSVHLVDHGVDAEGDDADDHADDEGDCGFREGEPRVPVETPARRRAALEALAQLVRRDLVRDGLVVESLEAGGGAGGDARLRPSPRVVVQHTVGVVHRRRRVVARATRRDAGDAAQSIRRPEASRPRPLATRRRRHHRPGGAREGRASPSRAYERRARGQRTTRASDPYAARPERARGPASSRFACVSSAVVEASPP